MVEIWRSKSEWYLRPWDHCWLRLCSRVSSTCNTYCYHSSTSSKRWCILQGLAVSVALPYLCDEPHLLPFVVEWIIPLGSETQHSFVLLVMKLSLANWSFISDRDSSFWITSFISEPFLALIIMFSNSIGIYGGGFGPACLITLGFLDLDGGFRFGKSFSWWVLIMSLNCGRLETRFRAFVSEPKVS